jgi:hypothetical protein
MRMSLNVLNHLGFNLYSNVPAVLSEVVANAYDADATKVKIIIEDNKIVIEDNGNGMSLDDINKKFLLVGYQKRENGEGLSPTYKRAVMGRKGIGKLSLFSIANKIKIFTVKPNKKTAERNALELDRFAIEKEIQASDVYHPKEIDFGSLKITKGTRIEITDFKKEFGHSDYLRRRLARRFSVLGKKHTFDIVINGDPITVADRDYFKKIQLLWLIGNEDPNQFGEFKFEQVNKLNGKIDGTSYEISGWIGTVKSTTDLVEDQTVNNNKISIICRGKMAQEDILSSFGEGGIYASYLIGEINADFLDDDKMEDISTSSRQSIKEDDPRYQKLLGHVHKFLKEIGNKWTEIRNEIGKRDAIKNAEEVNPALKNWFESLKTFAEKESAIELFSTIDNLHYDGKDAMIKKKELYKYGILAFEKLKLKNSLSSLGRIKSADDVKLAAIFTDLTDIEASMYYDIASERVAVIKKFKEQLDVNTRENLLRNYLFDNLWLLNPSWERATSGSALMEQSVKKVFAQVTKNLTKAEKKGRIDIKYRTAAGKHIIVELKRYKPGYKITAATLMEQVRKYRNALQKCLEAAQTTDTSISEINIESIIVLGEPIRDQPLKEVTEILRAVGARLIYYDQLIEDSLASYAEWMEVHAHSGKIKAILDKL